MTASNASVYDGSAGGTPFRPPRRPKSASRDKFDSGPFSFSHDGGGEKGGGRRPRSAGPEEHALRNMSEMDLLYAHPDRRQRSKMMRPHQPRSKWKGVTTTHSGGCFHELRTLINPDLQKRTGHEPINQHGVTRKKGMEMAKPKEYEAVRTDHDMLYKLTTTMRKSKPAWRTHCGPSSGRSFTHPTELIDPNMKWRPNVEPEVPPPRYWDNHFPHRWPDEERATDDPASYWKSCPSR